MGIKTVVICACCKKERWFDKGKEKYDEISTDDCDYIFEAQRIWNDENEVISAGKIDYLCNTCRLIIKENMQATILMLKRRGVQK